MSSGVEEVPRQDDGGLDSRTRSVSTDNTVTDRSDSSHSNDTNESTPEISKSHIKRINELISGHVSRDGGSNHSTPSSSGAELAKAVYRAQLETVQHKALGAYELIQERHNEEMKELLRSVTSMAAEAGSETNSDSVRDNVSFSYKPSPVKKVTKKIFVARDSVLTEMLKLNHINTLYNIFVAILIIFSLQTVVYELMEFGRVNIDFTLISWGFGKFHYVISIWLNMMACTLLVFPVFNFWTSLHQSLENPVIADWIFLSMYLVYFAGFLWVPVSAVFELDLPPVSSLVVVCEQVRLLMKAHAFVRENAPKTLSNKDSSEHPGFSRFLYFLFAPTLVYRDEYPRTEKINWEVVVKNITQLIACIFYTHYIFVRFLVPNFENFHSGHVTLKAFTVSVFGCMMPGTLSLLIGFYAVLHLWLNAWAEMLRFADRMFYKDWWNSASFASYYRNWNIVVHDWLYTYLYQDVYMSFGFRYKFIAMHLTFFISAVVHEYVLVVALKFFYPILFFQFGIFGVCIIYVINGRYERPYNIAMWVLLFIGTGLLMCMWSMEWYARRNCAPLWDSVWDNLLPRSLFCEIIAAKEKVLEAATNSTMNV